MSLVNQKDELVLSPDCLTASAESLAERVWGYSDRSALAPQSCHG